MPRRSFELIKTYLVASQRQGLKALPYSLKALPYSLKALPYSLKAVCPTA